MFKGLTKINNVLIAENLETIGSNTFTGCTSLSTLTIPKSVKIINDDAFSGLTSLTIIYMGKEQPDCKTSGGNGKVIVKVRNDYESTHFCEIEVAKVEQKIGDSAYYLYDNIFNKLFIYGIGTTWNYNENTVSTIPWNTYKTSIQIVEIDEGVTSIGDYLFYQTENIHTITIAESVDSIGNLAFQGNKKMKSIQFSSNLKSIGWNPFVSCSLLQFIGIDKDNTHFSFNGESLLSYDETIIYSYLGYKTSTTYEIPESIKIIKPLTFHELEDLTELTIGKNVQTIEERGLFNLPNVLQYKVNENTYSKR